MKARQDPVGALAAFLGDQEERGHGLSSTRATRPTPNRAHENSDSVRTSSGRLPVTSIRSPPDSGQKRERAVGSGLLATGRRIRGTSGRAEEKFQTGREAPHTRKATLACLAVAICASLALPSIATAQDFPPASRFQKVTLNDRPGEPMSLAVLPDGRVLHSARTGEIRIHNPRTGLNTLAADMRESPEGLYQHDEEGVQGIALDPNFAEQPLGLRLLLAAAEHAGRRPGHRRRLNEGDAPTNLETAEDRARLALFKGALRLSRFKFEELELDFGTEQKILDVPVDRGICCHVGGKIDFDGEGNLYLSTGDDTNPFESAGYSPIDERRHRNPAFDAQRTSANTNDLRGKILRIRVTGERQLQRPAGEPVPAGHGADEARDLRDGLPQPVPHGGRPQVQQRLRGRLLA